ncbi:hypothetical protein [Nocardioides sp.]|uniref:hypothetical protein n=1 Tax=Nocardioides sp. TaxID=35761 RepID=UPI003784C4E8
MRTAQQFYDDTAATAWRLARCLHRSPADAEDALARAYAELLAEPGALEHPRARTHLLALLTEHARAALPLRAG